MHILRLASVIQWLRLTGLHTFSLMLICLHAYSLLLLNSVICIRRLCNMCFVQAGRLEQCFYCLRGLFCDGSDTNVAFWMVIILSVKMCC